MRRFRQGMLIGLMLSVLLALTLSEERRRQFSHRLEELRNALPSTEQLKQSVQEVATRAKETGSNPIGQHSITTSNYHQTTA